MAGAIPDSRPLATPGVIGDTPPMAKYDPLATYLRRQRTDTVDLSFREIENLIGALLPNAAARAQWWADPLDAPAAGVQHKAWTVSGFSAELVGLDHARFTRRVEPQPNPART